MLFTGQAEITIDAKLRLAIPAKFRGSKPGPKPKGTEAGGGGGGEEGTTGESLSAWYCVPWPVGSLLRLYPEEAFHRLAQSPDDSLIPNQDLADFEASFFGSAERLDMDGTSRVRLPKWHLDLVGMPTEVVVVGARNRLEIRDRGAWMASQTERFSQLQSLVERIEGRNRRSAP